MGNRTEFSSSFFRRIFRGNYSEKLGKHPSGLYVSNENGMSFEYVGEQ
ncbi:hypothetical protein [Butyrivibrio proteoclasticus]|nr:hypothetical protein [Butyrivibrio proteoclasticus]